MIRMSLSIVRFVLLVAALGGWLGGGGSVCGQESLEHSEKLRFGDLSIDVPPDWKRLEDVAPDEGAWSFGEGGEGRAEVLLDRTLEQLIPKSAAVETRVELRWLDRPALLVEGVDFADAGLVRFRVLAHREVAEEQSTALRVRADAKTWSDQQDSIDHFFASGIDRDPAHPSSVPSPDDAAPGDSTVQSPDSKPPLPDSNRSSSSVPGIPKYRHARGGFVMTLPEGWAMIEGRALDRRDEDFDTIWNSRWDLGIVMARVREPVEDAEISLSQWEQQRRASLTTVDSLKSEFGSLAGFPAVTLSYRERNTDLSVWRISFVADGFRYPLTVYARDSASSSIPDEALELLSRVEIQSIGREASTWTKTEVDGMRLSLPRSWRQVDDPSRYDDGSGAEAIWIGETGSQGLARLSALRLTPFASPRGDVDRMVSLGMMPSPSGRIWWSLATRRVPAVAVATAAFPHAGEDGQRRILTLEVPWDRWEEYELVFREICRSVSFDGGDAIEEIGEPPWSDPYSSVEAIPGLRGLRQFSLSSCPEGIELREHVTREKQFVPAYSYRGKVDETIASLVTADPTLSQRLGPAMGDTVSVFDDAIRVQPFRNGVMVIETASRTHYWIRHAAREAKP